MSVMVPRVKGSFAWVFATLVAVTIAACGESSGDGGDDGGSGTGGSTSTGGSSTGGSSTGGSTSTGGFAGSSATGGAAGSGGAGGSGGSDPCGGCGPNMMCIYQAGGPGPGRVLCAENPICRAAGVCDCIQNQGECVPTPPGGDYDVMCQCDNGLE